MNSSPLNNTKTKGMILAAGKGTRLGELTKDCPKPLLPLGEGTILSLLIEKMIESGVEEIVVNASYQKEKLIDYLEKQHFSVPVHLLIEDELSGTAGAVAKAKSFLSDSREFLVVYGDLYLETKLREFIEFHRKNNAEATIALHKRANSNSLVSINSQNKINQFIERPQGDQKVEGETWVNSGVYCFSPCLFSLIPHNRCMDFPKDIFPKLIGREFFGYPIQGKRVAIDSVERYRLAQEILARES